MIYRKNNAFAVSVNPSTRFVAVATSVNPIGRYLIRPPLKTKKLPSQSIANFNVPTKAINPTAFSKNF